MGGSHRPTHGGQPLMSARTLRPQRLSRKVCEASKHAVVSRNDLSRGGRDQFVHTLQALARRRPIPAPLEQSREWQQLETCKPATCHGLGQVHLTSFYVRHAASPDLRDGCKEAEQANGLLQTGISS